MSECNFEVFVLGAGFTKGFNRSAPLLSGFLDGYQDLLDAEYPETVRLLNHLRLPALGKLNVETLFTLATLEAPWEESVARRRRAVVAEQLRMLIGTVISRSFSTSSKLEFKAEVPIPRFTIGECSSRLDGFAEYLLARKGSAQVLTFNYDTLLDNALEAQCHPYDNNTMHRIGFVGGTSYGFRANIYAPGHHRVRPSARIAFKGDVQIIKLHGSLNWCCRRGAEATVGPSDVYVLPTTELLPVGTKNDELEDPEFGMAPLIIPPLLDKTSVVRTPLLNVLWAQAARLLSRANRITFVGYSLPPTDYYSEFLFRKHVSNDCEIVVVGREEPSRDQVMSWQSWQQEKLQLEARYSAILNRDIQLQSIGADKYCGGLNCRR